MLCAPAGLETHLSVTDLGGLILAVIAFNLAAALTPTKGTFVPDEEELAERPKGALQVRQAHRVNGLITVSQRHLSCCTLCKHCLLATAQWSAEHWSAGIFVSFSQCHGV